MQSKTWFSRVFQLILALAVSGVALPAATPAAAGWHSLTGRLPAHVEILSPYSPRFSPDSQYVVFTGDLEVDDRVELYSVPISGTQPVKLNPTLAAGGELGYFAVTPDSQYVIFTAEVETAGQPDLYRVPIGGGQAAKLNLQYAAGHDVRGFVVDPDNQRVVYLAEQLVEDQYELFSVLITGGGVTRLNPNLIAGGDVTSIQIDPYLDRVVYRADQDTNEVYELYGVPIAGGSSVKLNPLGANVTGYRLNPQLQVVVFTATFAGSYAQSLYMNVTSGGLLTPLTPSLAANEGVLTFRITPDGARVVYVLGVGTPLSDYGNLYSVLIGGGSPTPLTAAGPGYGVYFFSGYPLLSNDRVIYAFKANAATATTLETVGFNGTGHATLHAPPSEANVAYEVSLSPNLQWVLFETYQTHQTFMVSAAGGIAEPFGDALSPRFTPDGSRVVALVPSQLGGNDLYSYPVSGEAGANLSNTAGQAETKSFLISPDGQSLVYAVVYEDGQTELRVSNGAAQTFLYLPMASR